MWETIKKYDKRWYGLLLVLLAAGAIMLFRNNEIAEKEQEPILEVKQHVPDAVQERKEETKTVMVDIKGAVVHPGVYEIRNTARVNDVVALAGGFTREADETKVNLAAKVHDEMMIYVPVRGETNAPSAVPSLQADDSNKIYINTASEQEISQLPGIGKTKAQAIIAYREEHGPFQKTEDLLNVTGIGEKTLEKIKEYIVVP
ncbi:helix-hairpin-helix domain-containing protein [Saccharococcus caldoxylosilyticus]|uniref:helix-hairpin-helix domain-containing protein n=1 Tax=Saccharococcus caldoxylosilyticus TaxID=81408 RepID=UPI0002EB1FB0|nr:helix-hairpin-helix domain-containing protein [Parageobacillus caldoxylosilyticus]BDG36856.1 competence protein ComE [Parageobacillus caldoxylosilyticus]BDG40645.1 competence protein ComE [Parageobacillus caldoxylosilyticus]BDG44395.1 competence protein ComE [Parageobacillus caldoxylosilyticus]